MLYLLHFSESSPALCSTSCYINKAELDTVEATTIRLQMLILCLILTNGRLQSEDVALVPSGGQLTFYFTDEVIMADY